MGKNSLARTHLRLERWRGTWLNGWVMATIYEEITEQIKAVMCGKDTVALGALRGLKIALQNAQIAKATFTASSRH